MLEKLGDILRPFAEAFGMDPGEFGRLVASNLIAETGQQVGNFVFSEFGKKVFTGLTAIGSLGIAAGVKEMDPETRKDLTYIGVRALTDILDPKPEDLKKIQEDLKKFLEGISKGDMSKVMESLFKIKLGEKTGEVGEFVGAIEEEIKEAMEEAEKKAEEVKEKAEETFEEMLRRLKLMKL